MCHEAKEGDRTVFITIVIVCVSSPVVLFHKTEGKGILNEDK